MDKLLDLAIDASHNGIMVIDRVGTILIYNKAARRIFNDGDADPVGRNIADLRPSAWVDLHEVLTTGVPQIGRKITLPEATIISNRTPLYDGDDIVGAVSVFQDVSEHEEIICQLQNYQKLHRELEAIFESSYDGLYITDGHANTLKVNSSYERITGLSRKKLIGQNMRALVADRVISHSATLEVLAKKKPVTLLQQIQGGKQVIVTGTPVYSEDGHITTVVTNVRDITELNELRRQLEDSQRERTFYYESLQEYHEVDHALRDLVVKSPEMVKIVKRAIKVAKVESSVLLCGESGVGKSMLARLIHKMSPRKEQPFVKINCGAIPPSLMESELFGYLRGAFTGALTTGKTGLIEAANRGTVFFDEIAELRLDMQVKLLEVIEDRKFKPVGGTEPVSVDVHIIAATNRNLQERISKGLFRKDLYYRLNVVPITIPPLRERREDIPALIESILENFNRTMHLKKKIDPIAIESLRHYDYPGNVRELINTIERMIVLSEDEILGTDDLPSEIKASCQFDETFLPSHMQPLRVALEQFERRLLLKTVEQSSSLQQAASLLHIHPTTLWRKLSRYKLNQLDTIA